MSGCSTNSLAAESSSGCRHRVLVATATQGKAEGWIDVGAGTGKLHLRLR